jgi:hypothetical protein
LLCASDDLPRLLATSGNLFRVRNYKADFRLFRPCPGEQAKLGRKPDETGMPA